VIRFRPVLDEMPNYAPGRSAETVAAEHALVEAIKLASNEVSLPPLPAVQQAIAAAAATANRYPDDGCVALREAIAARCTVQPEQVLVAPGSVALCEQAFLATCDPGDEAVWCWISFEAYPILARHANATIRAEPLRDHRYDVDAMLDAINDRTRVVVLCNPNNPTGTVVGRDELERLLAGVPYDRLVVLDEAYREFVGNDATADGLDLIADHPNLVVFRTFSKAYGLAGLRVGYAIGSDEAITALRKLRQPFGVSSIAQAAALAGLRAEAEVQARVQEITAERTRVTDACRALGVDVPTSEANFVWLPLGDAAAPVGAACEEQGVGLRVFPGVGVRATIGTAAENDRMLEALTHALAGGV
jgi:histidinol-phosphate aminotransferase